MATVEQQAKSISVARLIGIALAMRLMVDTGVQLFYPFLPVFAAGLGISAVSMGQLIGLRTFAGLIAPYFGAMADRRGYRVILRGGLWGVTVGLLLIASHWHITAVILGMAVLGIGLSTFVPTLIAYLSTQLPYAQRSRSLGVLEMSWALAGIVGLFLVGLSIDRWGWAMPLYVLAGLTLLVSFALGWFPEIERDPIVGLETVEKLPLPIRLRRFFDLGENGRSAWSAIIASALISFAALHLFGTYGQWLFVEYELDASRLGIVALLLGVANLIASSLISFRGDQLGKHRSIRWGTIAAILAFFTLPFFNIGLVQVVIGLFIAQFWFEFIFVNSIILCSEQSPTQRAKMMTLWGAMGTLGITVANLTGPPAYEAFGATGLAVPSGVALIIVWVLFNYFVHEDHA
ncbi:MAG: MFS transporter [Chloroflexota bacterium]